MLIDPALQWLHEQMRRQEGPSLWCADENTRALLSQPGDWPHKPQVLSNRWDIAELARTQGFTQYACDFDFAPIPAHSLRAVFYRVSKEKAVVHHIINQSLRALAPGGQLFLCGHKQEGIKTYIDKAAALFGADKQTEKNATCYSAVLTRGNTDVHPATALDTDDYPQLRAIGSQVLSDGRPITLYSKPGCFGWNKVDQGSAFLIAQLDPFLRGRAAPERLLDLGCGYGYLTLMSAHLPLRARVMTDNNLTALLAARHNCRHNNLDAEIIPADCGAGIAPGFDLILCNPPFHQGFSIDGDLTRRFLGAAHRLLAKHGTSLWVVNQFIPLERKAGEWFGRVEKLAENRSFKVLALSH